MLNNLELEADAYLKGLSLGEALFEYGSAEEIHQYESAYESKDYSQSPKVGSVWDGLAYAADSLLKMQNWKDIRVKALDNLQDEILDFIEKGQLIPYGYQLPRNIANKPVKIPADLFLSGEIDWNNSELIFRDLEFTGIRLLKNSKPELKVVTEFPENRILKNKKAEKPKFADLDPDLHIDEKRAAELLGLSPGTLQKYRVQGGGPEFVKIGKKAVRYKVGDLKQWALDNKKANTSY